MWGTLYVTRGIKINYTREIYCIINCIQIHFLLSCERCGGRVGIPIFSKATEDTAFVLTATDNHRVKTTEIPWNF